jgi:transcriptional regulator GlxA family with amidase domain
MASVMAKMDTRARNYRIAVFGFDGCSAWVAAGILEIFAVANVARTMVSTLRKGNGSFVSELIASTGRTVTASHGIRFAVSPWRKRYDAVIVPPIWCRSLSELERRSQALRGHSSVLATLAHRSKILASACSGAVLLADQGLLANRRATTCWWLADWFRRRFPETRLVPDQLLAIDRDRWTAAAGSAYVHLCLELIETFAGVEIARITSRLMLVEPRRGSQSPFLYPDAPRKNFADRDIALAVRYLDDHDDARITIAGLCRHLGLKTRTLNRHFEASLGMSPLAYLQARRVARAKQLLEGTGLSFEEIVARCGYEDNSSFRKLFARQVGMTPREYRSRFSRAGDHT